MLLVLQEGGEVLFIHPGTQCHHCCTASGSPGASQELAARTETGGRVVPRGQDAFSSGISLKAVWGCFL